MRFEKALPAMRKGEYYYHESWVKGSYIYIRDGEFITENGDRFWEFDYILLDDRWHKFIFGTGDICHWGNGKCSKKCRNYGERESCKD